MKKGVIIDRDTIAVLKNFRDRALPDKITLEEGADKEAGLMFCGALLFARDRKLIDKETAKHMFEQFKRDFEALEIGGSEDKSR